MASTLDNMRDLTRRLSQQREQADNKRGYCVLEAPELPASFCKEVLERNEDKIRSFLIRYARLCFETNEALDVDTSKLDDWRLDMVIASKQGETKLLGKALNYIYAIDGVRRREQYAGMGIELARRIYEAIDDAEGNVTLYKPDNTAYDYDTLYEKARRDAECRAKLYRN